MRCKRYAGRASAIQEGNPSNGCPETNTEEQSRLHVNDKTSVEATLVGHNTPLTSNGLPSIKDNSGTASVIVRRSERLKNSGLSGGTQAVTPVAEHVELVEHNKEGAPSSRQVSTFPVFNKQNLDGQAQVQQDGTMPKVNGSNLEEKIDYLVQTVDEFKSQGFERATRSSNEDHSPDFSYKTLYLDSQKKIEALLAENYELVKKLEYARGKVAAYERMKDVANASKEVLFVRATEAAAISLTPQMVHNLTAPSTNAAPSHAVDPERKSNSNSKKRKAKGARV